MDFSLIVVEKGGAKERFGFDKNEVTIGRVAGNDIVLPRGNVSKRHSRIVIKDGKFILVDLKSTNGTYVNGKKIAGPQVIRATDKVYIGDYQLTLEQEEDAPAASRADVHGSSGAPLEAEDDEAHDDALDVSPRDRRRARVDPDEPTKTPTGARSPVAREPSPSLRRAPVPVPERSAKPAKRARARGDAATYAQLLKDVHDRLIEYLDLRRLDLDRLGSEELWKKTESSIRDILDGMEADRELPAGVDRDELTRDVLNEALGLGPLEHFLADDDISEVMVNSASQIYIEREGRLELSDKTFSSDQAVLGVIERIVAPLGRRIDESSPLVDARLKDGSRVNAIIPPLALKGPTITIRKFKRERLLVDDLVDYKTLTPQMAAFLDACVRSRRNIVISGGTGSGKTTTLNIISGYIPDDERIITIEDAAELQLPQPHWIQLESRPPNLEGKGAVVIRDLVKNCLRMRPDRIIVGECRAGETLDMLQAMNTGHDGSLTTLHANSPRDAIARMETMVLMSGMELPIRAIREQIASAVDLIVQQTRFSDGTRRITHITEVAGMEVDVVTLQDIFTFKQEGVNAKGGILGRHVSTGFIPKFFEELQQRGMEVDMSIFREDA